MKRNFKLLAFLMVAFMFFLTACGSDDNGSDTDTGNGTDTPAETTADETEDDPVVELGGAIAVVSREEGSGARGAFEELVEVNTEEDGSNAMTAGAIIQNGNGVVASFVAENEAAIGYISFATFIERGDELVGLTISGVEPTAGNMLSGDYTLVRPFNLVYMPDNIGDIERAFIAFAQSTEGLNVLEGLGAVVDRTNATAFDASAHGVLTGTSTFGGSTSTEATALALMEEFQALFPGVEITYDATGSGAGITNAEEGTYDIGFASREIRDTELEGGLNVVEYCVDGIVIVVNPANGMTDITVDQLQGIYLGNITDWSDVQ